MSIKDMTGKTLFEMVNDATAALELLHRDIYYLPSRRGDNAVLTVNLGDSGSFSFWVDDYGAIKMCDVESEEYLGFYETALDACEGLLKVLAERVR